MLEICITTKAHTCTKDLRANHVWVSKPDLVRAPVCHVCLVSVWSSQAFVDEQSGNYQPGSNEMIPNAPNGVQTKIFNLIRGWILRLEDR